MIKAASRLSIAKLVIGQNAIILACMIAAFAVFLIGLNQVKVNGPVYGRIIDAADLTADILPPPLYVIETYLSAHRIAMAKTDGEIDALAQRIDELRKQNAERVAYWQRRDLPEQERQILFNKTIPTGQRIFDIIDAKFLPAIRARNAKVADDALAVIAAEYEAHRASVDQLVLMANGSLDNAEAAAAATDARTMALIYAFMILALAAAIAGVVALYFANVKPLKQVAQTLDLLAKGDEDVSIGETSGKSEIATIWKAVAVLRTAVGEAFRLKKTLDEMPVNVMVADPKSGVVTYINRATLNTLEGLALIPGGLSAFADEGRTIDVPASVAQRQNSVIADVARAPWHTRFKVGDETLSLRMDAILSNDGRYLAPMLTWEIVKSDEKKVLDGRELLAKPAAEPAATAEHIGDMAQIIADIASEANLLALNAAITAQDKYATPDARANARVFSTQSERLLAAVTAYLQKTGA